MNKTWKVVLAFTAVFLAGAIFGGLLVLRASPRLAQRRGAPALPAIPPAVLRHMADRLELTNEQKEKIRPLVDGAEDEIRQLRQISIKETGMILRSLQQTLAVELTAEQRKKLEKMQERQRELMREERPGLPPPRERKAGKREGGMLLPAPSATAPAVAEPVKP
jgi:Spy/CpxP family protein refolding chaperone